MVVIKILDIYTRSCAGVTLRVAIRCYWQTRTRNAILVLRKAAMVPQYDVMQSEVMLMMALLSLHPNH